MSSTAVEEAAAELWTVEVGGTMISGRRPVEPRIGPRIGLSALVEEDAALLWAVDVGCTIVSGRPLVVPISAAEETAVVG